MGQSRRIWVSKQASWNQLWNCKNTEKKLTSIKNKETSTYPNSTKYNSNSNNNNNKTHTQSRIRLEVVNKTDIITTQNYCFNSWLGTCICLLRIFFCLLFFISIYLLQTVLFHKINIQVSRSLDRLLKYSQKKYMENAGLIFKV